MMTEQQLTNINEEQLKHCIAEIGLLALSTSSCVTRQMTVHEGIENSSLGILWCPSAKLLATANALLDLAKVVKDNWDVLEQRPLKSFITQVASVDIKRVSSSPQSLIQAKLNPFKRQTLTFTRVESNQCTENEFLCYVLDVYLKDLVNGIAKVLTSLKIEEIVIPNISRKFQDERPNFMTDLRKRVQKRNFFIGDEKRRITETVSQLHNCAEWASQARKAGFLEEVTTPDEPPSPSLRLTGSPIYGSIFEQYSNCRIGSLAAIEQVIYLYRCTYQGQVRPTWEIYKIWCVARMYSTFIIYANMQPPKGEPTIFECIQTKRGTLELPRNKAFKLQGKLNDGTEFSITFWYQPELLTHNGELRMPDIKVEVATNGYKRLYCFNAEDRNYKEQGSDQFIDDVLEIARNKYLAPLGMTASFILHTDRQVNYWGEVPFNRILQEKFNLTTETVNANRYVNHQYGAISLIPGLNADEQFQKILQLLFKYHNNSLKTACLACGYQLEWGKDVVPSWKPSLISEVELISRTLNGSSRAGNGTGVYCSCPKCGDFWVVQICWINHHPLLKLIDCFHRHSDHPEWKGKWMYICPVCGSDPSPEDLGY
ncbi:hypothetical protein [Floridanema aerugineum]|uniref:Uncharacterized protein n=1 Tax=Floridaenema aerugineum BLCC-F46 TaxID=3153654 RepID=A0ABV4X9T3_9CYAN